MSQMKKFHHRFAIGWGAYCRQTDRQTDRQRQAERQTHRQTNFMIQDDRNTDKRILQ